MEQPDDCPDAQRGAQRQKQRQDDQVSPWKGSEDVAAQEQHDDEADREGKQDQCDESEPSTAKEGGFGNGSKHDRREDGRRLC